MYAGYRSNSLVYRLHLHYGMDISPWLDIGCVAVNVSVKTQTSIDSQLQEKYLSIVLIIHTISATRDSVYNYLLCV